MVKSAEDGLVRPVTSTERGNQGSLPSDPDNPDTGDGLEPLTCLVRAMLRDNTFLERSNPRLHSLKLRHLVGLQVDVIVATGARTALSLLKEATTTIPIVMTAAPDPVGEGFVQNLARPGGNFTGMSLQSLELTGKRLQLLKELVPRAQTVGILWDSTSPELWPVAQALGQTSGWKLLSVEIRDFPEIAAAFNAAADAGAGALLVPASGLLFSRASQIAELAALRRLPTMYELRPFVDSGGLVSYGANIEDIWRRAATYVDKILRGARPAELPIEQPTKFELVINSRAATALGLTISPSILIRADEVID